MIEGKHHLAKLPKCSKTMLWTLDLHQAIMHGEPLRWWKFSSHLEVGLRMTYQQCNQTVGPQRWRGWSRGSHWTRNLSQSWELKGLNRWRGTSAHREWYPLRTLKCPENHNYGRTRHQANTMYVRNEYRSNPNKNGCTVRIRFPSLVRSMLT